MTPPRRILVTGSRECRNKRLAGLGLCRAIERIYQPAELHPTRLEWNAMTLVHGGARGFDTTIAGIAEAWGMTIEKHDAEWHIHGRRAGHVRNARMVMAGADICVARPIGASRGTRDCMRLAAAAGIPILNLSEEATA